MASLRMEHKFPTPLSSGHVNCFDQQNRSKTSRHSFWHKLITGLVHSMVKVKVFISDMRERERGRETRVAVVEEHIENRRVVRRNVGKEACELEGV